MADNNDKTPLGKKIINFLIVLAIAAVIILVASFCFASYKVNGKVIWDLSILSNSSMWTYFGLGVALAVLFICLNLGEKGLFNFGGGSSSGAKVKTKGDTSKYYDTNWFSIEKLKKDPAFKYHTYDMLSSSDNIGIPIRAELVGKTLQVNMYQSNHTLVVGTTGAGKTTQFVDPTIQILSESHAKPCLVITDPKGEIYRDHSEKLRDRGYNILVFDLKEPFQSTCWNPMTRAYDLNYRAEHLNEEIKIHRGDDPRNYKLKCVSSVYYNEWYEFDGNAFADQNTLKIQVVATKQRLKNEAFEDLRDISTTLCPVQSTQDPIWERGAKDLVLGTMLAMLEDSENPELGMTREKFNFYNLSKILNLKDNDAYNPIRSLTEYFQGRNPLSLATQLANQVVANAEKTAKSYMGIVTDRMGVFSDAGICYATSINEMELSTFAEKPTALFIKIPDEKITRHPIATMFISQLYKILVDIANKRGGSLPRNTYFILDEFGNLPKIENFDTIITVARSRKIFFTLILQSYAQLTIKYGQEVSATVKDNCNIHIFIASNDQGTLEEFSKRCGNITVQTESVSASKGKKDESSSTTTSVSMDTRPLIYPAELATLKPNSGQCIVYMLQQSPLKSIFTPSYIVKKQGIYDMRPAQDMYRVPKPIDDATMYYDIRIRNQKILRNGNNNSGDFSI